MNYRIIKQTEDVIDYIISNIGDGDLSRYLIVFPGHRPKMFLLKRLAEVKKSPFVPPVILSFEDFILFIGRKISPDFQLISSQEIIKACYEIDLPKNNTLKKHRNSLAAFLPFLDKLYSDYETISKSKSIRDAKQLITKYTSQKGELSSSVKEYFEIMEALDKSLDEMKKSTIGNIYNMVSRIDTTKLQEYLGCFEGVIFVDIIPLYKSEENIVLNLSGLKNTEFLFQESEYLYKFQGIRNLIKIPEKFSDNWSKEIEIYESPDVHAEVLKLRERLREKNKDLKFDVPDTLIMLPESSTLKALHNLLLSELDEEDFNVSIGIPVATLPLSAFINEIIDGVSLSNLKAGEVKTENYYNVMTHNYVIALHKEETEINKCVRIIKQETTNRVYEFITTSDIEKEIANNHINIEFIRDVHRLFFEDVFSVKDVGDFAKWVCGVIDYISQKQNGSLNYGTFHIEAAYVHNKFKEISSSPIKNIPVKRSELRAIFNNFLSSEKIMPTGSPLRGLQVLGIYESRGIRFKNVYILDFNDENVYDYTFEDSFLPYKLRQTLQIPSKSEMDNYIVYFLDILIKQADSIKLFYRSEERLTKNRYLLRYIFENKKLKQEVPVTPIAYQIVMTPTMPRIHEKTEKIINRLKSIKYTATKLNTYLNCPAKFYYSAYLDLEEEEEVIEEPEIRELGIVIHESLKDFFDDFIEQELTAEKLKKGKKTLIDKLERHYKEKIVHKSPIYLVKEATLELLLENFLEKQIEMLKENGKTIVLETEQTHSAQVNIDRVTLNLAGKFDRVDRIERNGEVICHIIDYKTGSSDNAKLLSEPITLDENTLKDLKEDERIDAMIDKRSELIKSGNNVQLPFYAYLTMNEEKPVVKKPNEIKASFLFLKQRELDKFLKSITFVSKKKNPKGKEKKEQEPKEFDKCRETIESVLREILNPDVPFFALDGKGCDYCEYYSLCHKNETRKI